MSKGLLQFVNNLCLEDTHGVKIETTSIVSAIPDHIKEDYKEGYKLIEIVTSGGKYYLLVGKTSGKCTAEGCFCGNNKDVYYEGTLYDEESDFASYTFHESTTGGMYTIEMYKRDKKFLDELFG